LNILLKMIVLIMMTTTAVFGLTTDQINKIHEASKVGKTIRAKDGMTFETALPSIMGQESSWGVFVLGDKWDKNGRLKSVYKSSLGNFQIKLSTAKLTIKKYPKLYIKYKHLVYDGKSTYIKYEYHKRRYEILKAKVGKGYNHYVDTQAETIRQSTHSKKIGYYTRIIENPKWIKREAEGKKRAIRTMKWAKKELAYHKVKYASSLKAFETNTAKRFADHMREYTTEMIACNNLRERASKDMRLINRLLTDFSFGAEIAGHYLLSMYEEARKRGFSNPYKRAIGRYNGGWNNTTYYNLVMNKSVTVKKIRKKV